MNKQDFLKQLRHELSGLPTSEVDDIIRDQTEFINDAMASGRTEERAIEMIGSPAVFAQSIRMQSKVDRASDEKNLGKKMGITLNALFAVALLAPFNFIIILGPFLFAAGIIFAGWAVAGALWATAIVGIFAFFAKLIFISSSIWMHLSVFSFLVGSMAATSLMMIAMYYVTEYFVRLTIAYIKWNLQFIKSRN